VTHGPAGDLHDHEVVGEMMILHRRLTILAGHFGQLGSKGFFHRPVCGSVHNFTYIKQMNRRLHGTPFDKTYL